MRGAAGEGLTHALGEREVLGAAEDEAARRRIAIDFVLEIREQLGDALHFVEDGAACGRP